VENRYYMGNQPGGAWYSALDISQAGPATFGDFMICPGCIFYAY